MTVRDELMEITGASGVFFDAGVLDSYARDMSFVTPIRPDCIVQPANAEQIQKIVKLAIETRTPLIPVSSGAPHFRGDTIPGIGGAVIVDLSGMKKIINVDRTNRVAMFEPGVTFGELIPALAEKGLRLNMPLLPRSTKSVTASLLEREPVTMPQYHWDLADPMNCIEIYFGNGSMYRTGAAAGPGNLEEQWLAGGAQVEAAGPSSASWYRVIQGAQGTMGIVAWSSVRCEVLPDYEKAFVIGTDDITKSLDMMHWLVRLRLANECFTLNSTDLALIMAKDIETDYQKIKQELPAWTVFYSLAGYEYLPEERVKGKTEDTLQTALKLDLEPAEKIGGISAEDILKAVKGVSPDPYWKLTYKGACEDVMFLTINDKLPEIIRTMYVICNEMDFSLNNIGIYVQPLVQGVNMHCEFNLYYDPADEKEAELVRELARKATKELMSKGAFFSRPYGENTGLIMNRDAGTVESLKKVKTILDPNYIMNPGKLCF